MIFVTATDVATRRQLFELFDFLLIIFSNPIVLLFVVGSVLMYFRFHAHTGTRIVGSERMSADPPSPTADPRPSRPERDDGLPWSHRVVIALAGWIVVAGVTEVLAQAAEPFGALSPGTPPLSHSLRAIPTIYIMIAVMILAPRRPRRLSHPQGATAAWADQPVEQSALETVSSSINRLPEELFSDVPAARQDTRCQWCSTVIDGADSTCPSCGSPRSVRPS